jgi:hypothetical protein
MKRLFGKGGLVGVPSSDRLRLRIYDEQAFAGMDDVLLTRPLAPGLVESVVLDMPDYLRPINRSEIAGTSESEVFGTAVAQSIDREPHYTKHLAMDGVSFLTIGGTHRYVGAHIHVLARHLGRSLPPSGALVTFPLPEYVMIHVIRGEVDLFAAIEVMQRVGYEFFSEGDKAISPQLYWWRPGAYEQLPEKKALAGGQVPDLRPVGIKVDHRERLVDYLTADTNELVRTCRPY